MSRWALHPDRGLPAEPAVRAVARQILDQTAALPIVSMHGHVSPEMLLADERFPDPAALLVTPDHYLLRLLVAHGAELADLGVGPGSDGAAVDPRVIWSRFAEGWHLFAGTPTRYWLEHVLGEVFGVDEPFGPGSAQAVYDHIDAQLARPEFRPRALFERFGIEILATTDAATDALDTHAALAAEGWGERVVPTFRPDALFAIDAPGWTDELAGLEERTDTAVVGMQAFLDAVRVRRRAFVAAGARATDHGALAADTTPLPAEDVERIFQAALRGEATAGEAAAFTAHMLFESARMSTEDGLVMQLHPGVLRSYDRGRAARYGPDIGYDIPVRIEYTRALRPLLEAFGHAPGFRLVVFTVDEDTYGRELAPLAGVYPALYLGAPWWFLDTAEAMRRFREVVTDSAGLFKTAGFVDDTRAFCSIPARHDLARRTDAGYLARLVAEHRLTLDDAVSAAVTLAYHQPRSLYPSLQPTTVAP